MVRIGRRIGTRLSGFFIILGLLLCIPGILVLSLSNRIYGSPLVETGQIFQTTVGYNNTIDLTGHMTQGNNYDIRIDITVDATPSNPPNSDVAIRMSVTKTGTDIASLPNLYDFQAENFNSTLLTRKYEFKEDFISNADASFNFEILTSVNLTDIYIKIFLYENPRRVLASITTTIGLVLLIPGGLILAAVCCISGRTRTR